MSLNNGVGAHSGPHPNRAPPTPPKQTPTNDSHVYHQIISSLPPYTTMAKGKSWPGLVGVHGGR